MRRQRSSAIQATEEAVELLLEQLRDGPRAMHEISRAVVDAGLDRNDVLAAALRLKVRVVGKGGGRTWALPEGVR